ncbi:oxysterol-binding protein [Anaeramoeba flamelloides]|uniref:Oxysterol-binding protein n=1 Tax=Anaeramoeba flamelloides TaxID=1746091 RepID=A0ABQ8ZBA0_9EUKA|nr:oxysterol-binding protein [Anaeramoeba flamelloides]
MSKKEKSPKKKTKKSTKKKELNEKQILRQKLLKIYPYLKRDKSFRALRKFMQSRIHKSGGVQLLNSKEVKQQRVWCWDVVKQVGKDFLEGKDLTRIALPARLFEPRSFLERLAEGFAYAPLYLEQAYKATDPIERMKNVVCFMFAGLHLSLTNSKPFNPILGETYQCYFQNGTQIFCEQTSHHPPVSAFQLIGPNDKYMYHGYGNWSASFKGNSIDVSQKGKYELDFNDGTKYTWDNPNVRINGILIKDRVTNYEGMIKFTDKKNDLGCVIFFDPDALGFFKSLIFSSSTPRHCVKGYIYNLSKEKQKNWEEISLSRITGAWVDNLTFDEKVYWKIDNNLPERPHPSKTYIPSDSRYRKDRKALAKLEWDKAAKMKVEGEEKQRYDRKLRAQQLKDMKKNNN